jgi:protein-disulfide isomerase
VVPPPDTEASLDRAHLHALGLDRGPSRGPADAPVTIVMFTDSMCPFCGNVLGSIDQLWDEYPGKLLLIVKQFPVHAEAQLAAEAAYAADAQGAFWPMHDAMLANQDDLSEGALVGYARQLGLDVAQFRAALDAHTFAPAVTADEAAAKQADIVATPSFLINGRRVTGALPLADLRATIDAALADR